MNRRTRLSWIVFILLMPIAAFSQTGTPTPTPDPSATEVVYTGRLFGYFRVPSLQLATYSEGLPPCPASSENDSEAAKEFKKFREGHKNSVLLGTGDNFAPQLEARVFSYLDETTPDTKYHAANKELYNFDTGHKKWVHIDDIDDNTKEILESGKGTIPTDNVGCFLAAAGYAAVVPGRHDFYFGAERVRQLARLMAALKPEYGNKSPTYKDRSPQMLGANLVLKTTLVDPGDPVPDKGKPTWMDTNWPKEYSLQNLPKTVYPWFQSVKISISDDDPDELAKVAGQFKTDRFYLCKSKGMPNKIDEPEPKSGPRNCSELKKPDSAPEPGAKSFVYKLPIEAEHLGGKNGHFSTLTSSTNYALCVVRDLRQEDRPPDKKTFCQRFSVYEPFFYYPHKLPEVGTDYIPQNLPGVGKDKYTDPDPFVFIEKEEGVQPNEVVIFGVVDPQLGENVGVLNFSWRNNNEEYKSTVSVEDPAQALREQVEYFDNWYKKKFGADKKFEGLKILLAQMNPQRARVLAARLSGFQIVVAGADQEQATTKVDQTLEWYEKNKATTFVAVPAPFFNTQEQKEILNPGFVHAKPKPETPKPGSAPPKLEKWTLESHITYAADVIDKERDGSINHKLEKTTASNFHQAIDRELKQCIPADFDKLPKTLTDRLKLVTLCAMREHVNADLAIVQKRDFFPKLPGRVNDEEVHVQQFLDRFIWKGDLLTVMFVSGKAIKEALKHSSRVDGEERAVLTLDSEKGRGFEQVGARYDSNRDQFLINELPIEDAKRYTVVTTDYLGAGDTGYPELVAAALNPRKQPDAFPNKLETISSIVCRKLYPGSEMCLPNIDRGNYLDTIAAEPATPYEQRGAVKKFFRLSPFGTPDKPIKPKTPTEAHQQEIERRGIWTFSLRRLSLGFNTLKNNMTDAQVDERFGGISTSGVTAHRNRGVTVKMDTRSAISWHKHELFLEGGVDYQDISKGRANDDMEFDQITNRFTVDPGWIWRIYRSRSKPHLATVFSIHLETPFRRPVDTFFLSSRHVVDPVNNISVRDRLVITQQRGFLVLPRFGLRWQNRDTTYFEVGFQRGKEFDAFTGYQFVTGNNAPVVCVPDVKKTIVSCIEEKSKEPNPTITKNSVASAILMDRPRSGFYWKSNFTLPFGSKVKYEFSDEGDFFAKNFDSDLVTDTRFRDYTKHSLKFAVFPSLSFGPALNVLLYQNKINKNWLTQKQFTLEATVTFDLFNSREKWVQVKNKP